MKKVTLVIGLCIVLLSYGFRNEATTTLTVNIDNIKTLKGDIYVNVYNKNGFPEPNKQIARKKIDVNQSKHKVKFQLPSGQYAIALYHDENSNNKMDKNFFGYPLEPYAFSKNFVPTISAPDFEDCVFSIQSTSKTINISLIQ